MSISLHCEHCGKNIEAPDNAGGRWGKCPACHNRVYVPAPDLDEELKLAPVDEEEEARRQAMLAEAQRLRDAILSEKEVPDDGITPASAAMPSVTSDRELTQNIITYLRQMANGELADAKNTATSITPYGKHATEILDRIAVSEIPEPELSDIPPQILSALIRDLRAKLSD